MSVDIAIMSFASLIPTLLLIISFFAPPLSIIPARDKLFRNAMRLSSTFLFILASGIAFSLQKTHALNLGNEFIMYIDILQMVGVIGIGAMVIYSFMTYFKEMREYKEQQKNKEYED